MNRRLIFILGLVCSAFPVHSATNVVSVTTNLTIPDDIYNGSFGSMTSAVLNVSLNETVQDVNITLGISHTYIGDLVIKLKSPLGTVVTLMSRPGVVETADDGNDIAGFGDSSNLTNDFPITFDDAASISAETMGNTILTTQVVCQDDGQCIFIPNSGAATSGYLGLFNGENAVGNWTLYVGDAGALDTGAVASVTLTIVTPDGPRLEISTSGTNVVLAWPTNPPGYILESVQPLQASGWNTVTNSTVVSGTNFTVTLPASGTNRFFHLQKP